MSANSQLPGFWKLGVGDSSAAYLFFAAFFFAPLAFFAM